MKPLKYKGYRINRIERCGCRRVTIFTGDNTTFLRGFDGYNMDELVEKAKKWIDVKETPMVVEVPKRPEIKFRLFAHNCIFAYERLTDVGWQNMVPQFNPEKYERWSTGTLSNISNVGMLRVRFTGIKDSKGKEIYEGDLVVSDQEAGIHEIWWEKESASFTVGADLWPNAKLTVIGNIIENADLVN